LQLSSGIEEGKVDGCNQGAVENMLERSSHLQLLDGTVVEMTDSAREALLSKLNVLSSKSLRCLGLAYKDELEDLSDYDGDTHPAHKVLLEPANYNRVETNLIFVGMVGLRVSPLSQQDFCKFLGPFVFGVFYLSN